MICRPSGHHQLSRVTHERIIPCPEVAGRGVVGDKGIEERRGLGPEVLAVVVGAGLGRAQTHGTALGVAQQALSDDQPVQVMPSSRALTWRCTSTGPSSRTAGARPAPFSRRAGSRRADDLDGAEGDDNLLGRRGRDDLDSGNGDDSMAGGAGHDRVEGGACSPAARGATASTAATARTA